MIIDVGTKSDLIGNQRRSGYAILAAFFLIAKKRCDPWYFVKG